MWLTVRRAVVASVLLGVLLPAIVAGTFLSEVIARDKLKTQIARTLQQDADVLIVGVRDSLWALDREAVGAFVDAVMKDAALVSVEVLDARLGRVVFREIAARREGRIHLQERPVLYRGETIGYLRIAVSEAPLRQALNAQLWLLSAILSMQVIGSVALILFVLQRRIGRPLRKLSDAAASLAQGEFSQAIVSSRDDEIGQVAARLELTRQALQGLFHSLEQKNRALEVDLRERMRVEAALRDREQRLRTLVAQSPLAVIEFDLGWHILDWNEAAVGIFGWRREEVLGRHASMLMAESQERDGDVVLNRGAANGRYKRESKRSDGGLITCQWYNSIIRDGSGASQRIVAMVEDITDRQRIDDELRRLAMVVRLSNDMIVVTDAEGRIEWCNRAFETRCGAAGEDARGELLLDRMAGRRGWGENDRYQFVRAAILRREPVRELSLPCETPTGIPFWASLELQPIRDEHGDIKQWGARLSDETERRHLGDVLRNIARLGGGNEARVFLEQLVSVVARGAYADAAYVALHEASCVNVIALWANAGWPLHAGAHPLDGSVAAGLLKTGSFVIPKNAMQSFGNDPVISQCDRTQALIVEAVHDGETEEVLGHLCLLFGSPLANSEEAQSLAELGAARAGVELSRLKALDAVKQSEQKFFSIFQSSPIPILLVSQRTGICLDFNLAFLKGFGFSRAELIGHVVTEAKLYADAVNQERFGGLLGDLGPSTSVDVQLKTRDGDIRDCQLHRASVPMGAEECLLFAIVDVTSLLQAQRQVEELNLSLERRVIERTHDLAEANTELEETLERLKHTLDDLMRSERLASLGSLVAGITHELNTPIGNSLMVSSTLRDVNRSFRKQMELGLRKSVLENYVTETEAAADILTRNLHRAGELITSFKQVAVDQTTAKRRDFELADVINEIVMTMQPLFRSTAIVVKTDIPPNIRMKSFPGPLGQVVANLLNNAILHAFSGRTDGVVSLTANLEDDETLILQCTDDGVGISPENLRQIFVPFFTTRTGAGGTGLGLNIVRDIVTDTLAGEISVASELGRGTTFTIRMPLDAPIPSRAPELHLV